MSLPYTMTWQNAMTLSADQSQRVTSTNLAMVILEHGYSRVTPGGTEPL